MAVPDGPYICIDIDPNAPHDDDCGFWHGFACTCKPEMKQALEVKHDEECDFLHGSGYNRCSCGAVTDGS